MDANIVIGVLVVLFFGWVVVRMYRRRTNKNVIKKEIAGLYKKIERAQERLAKLLK